MAGLARDWARELVRVGTPDNMSAEARSGFEEFVDRIDDLEGGDLDSMTWDWQGEDWESDEAKAVARYVTNTCP
ncbi:hypothetical protein [Nocardioides piscis]|uniref:Uncharacterized protein n=1 Tax=Nocardioides piscis TaxID=2714938 RepID=A0A6G7YDT8_9ACTN|nr:hypothetical protein [Nocardioides piscis]QIK74846.1 hypothetical protein G7071_04780 [Nocardioides piscis]